MPPTPWTHLSTDALFTSFSGFRHAADPGGGEKRFEFEGTGKVCLVGGGAANLPFLQQQHVVRGVSGGLTYSCM